jgi:putative Holliday junction resolvase
MPKRIMGLDLGDKRIGVAVSDETGLIAQAADVIHRRSAPEDLEAINRLAARWQIGRIVVGLPINMNATVGPQAKKTMRFVQRLRQITAVPVDMWDERLTSQAAERLMIEHQVRRAERRQRVDALAAALILQGYLDHQRVALHREETHMAEDKEFFDPAIPEDDDEIITLTDEEGREHEFVVVDVIEVTDQEYAILLPIDTDEDEEAEAVILRLEKDDDGDDILVDIESEEEWERVAQAYEELLDQDPEA